MLEEWSVRMVLKLVLVVCLAGSASPFRIIRNLRGPEVAASRRSEITHVTQPPQVKTITINQEVRVPYPVHIEKKVRVPIKIPIEKPYPVYVPKPYPVTVEKHVPYPVKVPVIRHYPVQKTVHVPYKVPVEKPVPYRVEWPYPVYIEKKVHYPVEREVPVPIKVYVEKPYPVKKPVEHVVPYPISKTAPVRYEVLEVEMPTQVETRVEFPQQEYTAPKVEIDHETREYGQALEELPHDYTTQLS